MNTNRTSGFTIIEMLVAVALFSVVVMMSVAALASMIDANQKARSVRTAMDNLSFTMEDMIRNIRLGSQYYCKVDTGAITLVAGSDTNPIPTSDVQDCKGGFGGGGGGPHIEMSNRTGQVLDYEFDSVKHCIAKKQTTHDWGVFTDGVYQANSYIDSTSGFTCVTSPDITINSLVFYVYNTAPASLVQPYVVITVSGTAGSNASTQTDFTIMTTAAQRIPHNAQ